MKNLNKAIPILDVSNYAESLQYYQEKLGFRMNWDWDGFGSVSRDQVELFLSFNPNGRFGGSLSVFVQDVHSLYAEFVKTQANITLPPKKMEWGVIELHVKDPDGHTIRFSQTTPAEEIVVERTELSAKIEKRLAAVIEDLAGETGRSVGELMEEVFLHSFEPMQGQEGHASASPHSIETYALIAKLKQKHNLDYETHDSYAFVEKDI